jgi:hypothetical protein
MTFITNLIGFFTVCILTILWSSSVVTLAYIGPVVSVSTIKVKIKIEVNRVDMNVKIASC